MTSHEGSFGTSVEASRIHHEGEGGMAGFAQEVGANFASGAGHGTGEVDLEVLVYLV